MGGIFGGGAPAQPEPEPLPARDDQAVKDAERRAKAAARNRRGRRSTILTGGQGVTTGANTTRAEASGGTGQPAKTVLG